MTQLLPLLPPGRRLIEPFVGAGSVFLAAQYDCYLLNDANSDLVAMWVAVKLHPREFSERAAAYFTNVYHSKEAYLKIRDEFNGLADRFERAVRLPYLNRFGFNGLFRVNRAGAYNTPYGSPLKVPAFPWDRVEDASEKLERALVLNGGFEAAIQHAGAGDVVYCDPPYLCSADGASFTGYTSAAFGLRQHEQLVEAAISAVSRGAHVLISNHDTPQTRALYRGWRIVEVSARRSVASSPQARGIAREIVALLPGSLS